MPPHCSPHVPTILVADDEALLRRLLQIGLRDLGYDVLAAESGDKAVEVYRTHGDRIDAVILDVNMPPGDGPHACRELLALNPGLPCCFMTGGLGRYSRDELLGLGAVEIFDKPFDFATIAHTLDRVLSQEPVAAC